MDLALRMAINNVVQSRKFLRMAIAFGSPFLKDYEESHEHYLKAYKQLTGKDFEF